MKKIKEEEESKKKLASLEKDLKTTSSVFDNVPDLPGDDNKIKKENEQESKNKYNVMILLLKIFLKY
jgi:hypothetical protein